MEYCSAIKIIKNKKIKKEEKFTLHDSMEGPGKHYAKWNKPTLFVGETPLSVFGSLVVN